MKYTNYYATLSERMAIDSAKQARLAWSSLLDTSSDDEDARLYEAFKATDSPRIAAEKAITRRMFPVWSRIADSVNWIVETLCACTFHLHGCWLLNSRYSPLRYVQTWAWHFHHRALLPMRETPTQAVLAPTSTYRIYSNGVLTGSGSIESISHLNERAP